MRARTSYGVAEVNKEVKATRESDVLATNQQSPGVAYLQSTFPTRK
jgi:hypothetical protein